MVALLLGCGLTASPRAQAQQEPTVRRGCLFNSQSATRVQIVQGRLAFQSQETMSLTQAAAQPTEGRQETLRIQTTGGVTTLLYVISDRQVELTYDVQQNGEIHIRRRPRLAAAGPLVEFRQPARGPLRLDVASESGRQSVRAASLWHLLLMEPDLAQNELAPLVEVLQPSLRLAVTAEEVREKLFSAATSPTLPLRDEVSSLVRQLASPEFRQRQAADRALRSLGPAVGPHLLALDPRSLTTEQRERVRLILDGLAGPTADTPERIAGWLVTDPRIWVELLSDPQVERRAAALEHLQRLTGKAVAFDPHGPQDLRTAQLDALRR